MKKIFLVLSVVFLVYLLMLPTRRSGRVLDTENEDYMQTLELKEDTEVTISVYHPIEEETDSTPLQTADLSYIDLDKLKSGKIRWIAVSRDLLGKYRLGSKVRVIAGDKRVDGEYYVRDVMGKRWKNRIDILRHPDDKRLGLWKGVVEKI